MSRLRRVSGDGNAVTLIRAGLSEVAVTHHFGEMCVTHYDTFGFAAKMSWARAFPLDLPVTAIQKWAPTP